MNPTFILLCGIPYSGKTWIREKFVSYLKNLNRSIVILSMDDYVLKKARENNSSYADAFGPFAGEASANMITNLDNAIARNLDIISDCTSATAISRRKFLDVIPFSYDRIAVVCEANKDTIISRMKQREAQTVPMEVIESFQNIWQPPTEDEGFSQIISAEQLINSLNLQ